MASAVRYQGWVFTAVRPHLGARILEIGSGIGSMTQWLTTYAPTIATDVDDSLLETLRARSRSWAAQPVATQNFDIAADTPDGLYSGVDTVISFNVLEHIEDDVSALRGMRDVLMASDARGPRRLIIFVPAHQWAFGEIDRTLGHCRRYSRKTLGSAFRRVGLADADLHFRHFNTIGVFGWVLVGRVLRRPTFGEVGVRASERLIPLTSRIDGVLHRPGRDLPLGQSLMCVATVV
jgi:SAM-dependent methyltransferase